MKTTSKTNCNLFTRIENSKGRFFGLYLKNGDILNAQYRNSTNSYLTVYDRNAKATRKVRKTSVTGATV
jgi:hypothetical protein